MDSAEGMKNFWNGFSGYYANHLEDPNLSSAIALSKMVRFGSAKSILEVGCATGSFALHWLQSLSSSIKYISIDISDEMIRIAQERKESLKHRLNDVDHKFLVGNAEDLSFIPDESIDIYIAPLCLHLVSDAPKALKEAMRVLKKGGRIGFSVLGTAERNMFFSIPDDRIRETLENKPQGEGKYHLGKREKLIQLAKDAGIKVDCCWEHDIAFDIFEEEDLKRLRLNPIFKERFEACGKETQERIIEDIRKTFLKMKENFVPLKLGDNLLVGRKPES